MTIPSLKLQLSEIQWRVSGNRGPFASKLKDDGVYVDKKVITEAQCTTTRDKIDALIATKCDDMWVDDAGSDHRIWNYEKYDSRISQALDIPTRLGAIEQYLGRSIRKWFLMANRVDPVTGNLGSGGGLHRDSSFTRQVKVIWYLNDVNEGNGPFSYLPKSAEPEQFTFAGKKTYENRLDHLRPLVDDKMVSYPAPAGSCLIADTRGIHMGQPATLSSRYTVTLYTEYGFISF